MVSETSHFLGCTMTLTAWLALAVSTIAIFIRSVYRVAELSGGFGGSLANDQATFMVLEGPMVIIAVLAMTVFHPGTCFNAHWETAGWTLRSKH
jgi:hypothetical protein